ncbi:MAG: alpha/beta hydrolase family protein [Bacillota bacterium]
MKTTSCYQDGSSLTIGLWAWALVVFASWGGAWGKDFAPIDQLPVVQELPNPFVMDDGSPVRSKEDWARRRAELKESILYYEYGRMAPPPGNVRAEVLSSTANDQLGAVEKKILLTMGPGSKVSTHLELTIPTGKGPFPVIITGDLGWGKKPLPIQGMVAKRGYILAEFDRTEIAPDSKDRTQGVYPVYPEYDWGAVSAWAWGFHRVVDYLITQDYVDASRIIVTGHSRGGKATLLAGATDDRIALTAPNNSGCGGAGCYRFQAEKSERIEDILKNFPFWFSPRFGQFIGKTDRLPFDQHSLKALVAPRALLSTEALGDLWANPEGTQQSHLAAKEVFNFLGAGDRIGIYYREGKHEHNEGDWTVLMDFADRVLLHKTVERKFDELAYPNSRPAYKWTMPKGE